MVRQLAAIVVLAVCGSAQEAVFRTETTLRQIEVRVSDKQGSALDRLTAEDFTLIVDGEPREIASLDYIERPAVPPQARSGGELALDRSSAADTSATRVLLLFDASFETRPFVFRAARDFLEESWPEGALVAFEGMRFTEDRQKLIDALDLLLRDKVPGRSMVDFLGPGDSQRDRDLEEFEEFLVSLDEDPGAFLPNVFDENLAVTKYRAFRYRDVVRQMSAFPGKKAVILFRDGLPMEPASQRWWEELTAEAVQYRVAFYTVDGRGLMPGGTGAGRQFERREESALYQLRLFERGMGSAQARSRMLREMSEGRSLAQDAGRNGLRQLAYDTGGRAVLNTNGLGEVFDRLRDDLSSYYLLGFYEGERSRVGRPHRLRVTVDAPGAKAEYIDRYSTPRPFGDWTATDKFNHIYHALHSGETYRDLPVSLLFETFAGSDGRPILHIVAGGVMGDLAVTEKGGEGRRAFSIALQLETPGSKAPPRYEGYEVVIEAPLEKLRQDDAALHWSHPAAFGSLTPGERVLRLVVRDDEAGSLGGREVRLKVPDYRTPNAVSSLVLTDEFSAIDPEAPEPGPAFLVAEGTAFRLSGRSWFERGRRVAVLYDIYNASERSLERPSDLALMLRAKGGRAIRPPVDGRMIVDRERKALRFVGFLDTRDLPPGGYDLFAEAPGASDREQRRFLRRGFVVRESVDR